MLRLGEPKEVGERLKRLRETKQMRREEVAYRLDCSYQNIQNYERGSYRLDVYTVAALARVFDMTPTQLYHLLMDGSTWLDGDAKDGQSANEKNGNDTSHYVGTVSERSPNGSRELVHAGHGFTPRAHHSDLSWPKAS